MLYILIFMFVYEIHRRLHFPIDFTWILVRKLVCPFYIYEFSRTCQLYNFVQQCTYCSLTGKRIQKSFFLLNLHQDDDVILYAINKKKWKKIIKMKIFMHAVGYEQSHVFWLLSVWGSSIQQFINPSCVQELFFTYLRLKTLNSICPAIYLSWWLFFSQKIIFI